MATDQERLLLLLEANTRNFERSLEQSERQAERRFAAIEKRANQMVQKTQRDWDNFANQARTAIATLGVGFVVRDVVALGDVWTTVGNRIAFAGVASERVAATQQAVADIASRTRSDLDATADLFSRMFRSSEDLGASQERVLRVTELVSKALAGAAQSERQGAIRQLGQGLGAGNLAGDELRSILENSRPIAEAIAAEFETTVGNLRVLGKQGVLESRRVFEAIERAGDEIDASFARTNFTVADSFVRLRTEAARFIGTNEQTSGSIRGLTALIDGVANNFDLLADAVVIAATVIGGSFAGTALARAIIALQAMIVDMTTATTRAATLSKALTFFGGSLGIALTAAGGAMAYLATQTDIFASQADRLQAAEDSLYSALIVIQGLELASEGAAEGTGQVAENANWAARELDQMTGAADDASGAAGDLEQATRDLADIEKERTLGTIQQAIADREALVAAERRAIAVRRLANSMVGITDPEIADITRERNAAAIQASEAEIAAQEQRVERLQAIYDRVANGTYVSRAPASPDENGGGNGNGNGRGGSGSGRSIADLEADAALTLARLRNEEARVRELQDAAELERRTAAYVEAGLASTAARVKAESEVRAEREAMNAEAQRSYELSRQQDNIDLQRIQNNIGLADEMSDQLEIARRTSEYVQQLAVSEAEAARMAREYVEARRAALNQEREAELNTRGLEDEADAARLRGDARAERALERQLELQARITELRRLGLSEEAAAARAEAEVEMLEQADLRGKFRDWFSGGVMAALEGDLDDFFENWIRERAARGLENALDEVSDILFDSFRGVLSSVMQSGQDGIGQAIAAVFTGGATGGLDKLGEESAKAGEALGTVLAAAASDAAAQVVLTGTAAAATAAQETAAGAVKRAAVNLEVNSMLKLTASANAAAAALSRIAATGGVASSSGGLVGSILSGLFKGFTSSPASLIGGGMSGFGGFRAGGGSMAPGMGYIVGERGRELVIPQTPSFVVPNNALGGGNVTLVDNTTIAIQGASTAEMAQLQQTVKAMINTRNQAAVQAVRQAMRRPRGLGG